MTFTLALALASPASHWLRTGAALLFALGAFALLLREESKRYTPQGLVLYAGMWVGLLVAGICGTSSTLPSSMPRVSTKGKVAWTEAHQQGRSTTYTFGLLLDSGITLGFRAPMGLPPSPQGQTAEVTYLDEKLSGEYPRAIDLHLIDGPNAGWEHSVNANWLGLWTGVPLGLICGLASLFFSARYVRSTSNTAPSTGTQPTPLRLET